MKVKFNKRTMYTLWSLSVLIWGYILYQIYDVNEKKQSNPYHDVTIDLSSMNDEEKKIYLQNYFEKLSDYPLFTNIKSDAASAIINDDLIQLCLNNKYIDYNDLSDRIAVTTVNYSNQKSDIFLGQTHRRHIFYLPKTIYEDIEVIIYGKSTELSLKSTYYHEMIHAIFPRIKDSRFFDETLTDIIEKECFEEEDQSYGRINPITKMWIETLGEDVFMNMRATGKLDSFKDSLKKLGYTQNDIDNILTNLNNIINLFYDYLKNGDYSCCFNLKKEIEEAIKNIENAYQIQYGRKLEDNIIMKSYIYNIKGYFENVEDCYYYVDYFTSNENGKSIYWFNEEADNVDINLTDSDYNLENGEPKKLRKIK